VAGEPVAPDPERLNRARMEAVFTDAVLAELPEEERALLRGGGSALEGDGPVAVAAQKLQPFAIEGTTPASPVLYVADPEQRADAARDAEKDMRAFAAAAPNVGRSLKVLHVGAASETDPHKFYHDFVEFSVHGGHPLFQDAALREMGHAATQFVLTKLDGRAAIDEAGASPRALCTDAYGVVPLHEVGALEGRVLDIASLRSKADVIPPRAATFRLSAEQTRDVRRSIEALKALDAKLEKTEVPGHCVAFILAYSTLVNNPLAVEHFCDRIAACSRAGVVDFMVVEGLAFAEGEDEQDEGHFVVVNSVMEV
jgi:hypothetical protein